MYTETIVKALHACSYMHTRTLHYVRDAQVEVYTVYYM
jgi:hypothetical protein